MALIFWSGFAARLIHVLTMGDGFYFSDFGTYEKAALSLMAGNGFDPEYTRPPLYPLYIAAIYLVFGQHLFPLRFIQVIIGALSSILVYKLGETIFDRRVGIIAGGIAALYPYYVFITGLLYPTLFTAILLMGSVYFVLRSSSGKPLLNLSLATFLLSLASLAVPASISFAPFLMLWLILFSGQRVKQAIFHSLFMALVIGLTLLPWTIVCYQQYGRLVFIDPRVEKHLPVVQQDGEPQGYVDYGHGERIQRIVKNPGKFIGNVALEFIHFWSFVPDRVVTRTQTYREEVHGRDQRMELENPYTSSLTDWVSILTYGPVFILAIVGVIFCGAHWRLASLILMLILSHAIAYSFFFTQVRYRLPVEFCLMIFAGYGITILLAKIRTHRSQTS